VGEPWHPTQLGVTPRETHSKGKSKKDGMAIYGQMALTGQQGHRTLSRTPDTSAVSLRLTVTSAPPKCSERPRSRSKTSPRTLKPPPKPPISSVRSPTPSIRAICRYDVAAGTTSCMQFFCNFLGSRKCFCNFWFCW